MSLKLKELEDQLLNQQLENEKLISKVEELERERDNLMG